MCIHLYLHGPVKRIHASGAHLYFIYARCIQHQHLDLFAPCPALPGFYASRMSRPALIVHTLFFLYFPFPFLDTLASLFRPQTQGHCARNPKRDSLEGGTQTQQEGVIRMRRCLAPSSIIVVLATEDAKVSKPAAKRDSLRASWTIPSEKYV